MPRKSVYKAVDVESPGQRTTRFSGIRSVLTFLLLMAGAEVVSAGSTLPAPDRVKCAVEDKQKAQSPGDVHLDGFLGKRIDANAFNRLLTIDEDTFLQGFRHRPGSQSWDGEHVGKWLHAATLAWVYTGDARLRAKLDRVAVELAKCQLEDGYLGTYLPEQRWTEWDVWAHKYDMIGLLTYYRYTGNEKALEVSQRCADLLCQTFGTNAGQKNILDAGYHVGMAPSSVLEPMVLLYRLTGEQKYLDFARYIVGQWETPSGPKIMSTLLSGGGVNKVGNGKAYEMLSCLNGLLELYRTTGDGKMLQAVEKAWQDIVDKRLYITGTASYQEIFHDDFDLPNGGEDVAETCVTVTWEQLNAQLLRLTDEARFADQLERTVYNQLLGAQRPDGCAWGYYVQMEGTKPYSVTLSGNCCLSSGPRGVALIPTFAFGTDPEGAVVNLLGTGHAKLTLADGTRVGLAVDSQYPNDGRVRIEVSVLTPRIFSVKARIPAWCDGAKVTVNDAPAEAAIQRGAYVDLRRKWANNDVIELTLPIAPREVIGDHGNAGKVAFARGPLILAADDALNPDARIGAFRITATNAHQVIEETNSVDFAPAMLKSAATAKVRLTPFADAGATLAPYQVWLPLSQP